MKLFLKFATHEKQLVTLKKRLITHNFISNSQNKFATPCKITCQLIKRNPKLTNLFS